MIAAIVLLGPGSTLRTILCVALLFPEARLVVVSELVFRTRFSDMGVGAARETACDEALSAGSGFRRCIRFNFGGRGEYGVTVGCRTVVECFRACLNVGCQSYLEEGIEFRRGHNALDQAQVKWRVAGRGT